jgi:hypothetical protein
MDRDGFVRYLTCINRYITVVESIVTIGINGICVISGQVESGNMVIDVNLTSHEDLKSSNFECFLYMSVNYKRKH